MEINFILISLACGFACHYAYKLGIKEGAERTIKVLHKEKVISYDSEGQIYPNPFYKK
jgi:hypothetical protein|tara:strand:- start:1198 stop:1371 length:174 start_codon:yes stop_codon:yes gene_type:complete